MDLNYNIKKQVEESILKVNKVSLLHTKLATLWCVLGFLIYNFVIGNYFIFFCVGTFSIYYYWIYHKAKSIKTNSQINSIFKRTFITSGMFMAFFPFFTSKDFTKEELTRCIYYTFIVCLIRSDQIVYKSKELGNFILFFFLLVIHVRYFVQ